MSRHEAIMTRHDDGTVTVEHADPVIHVDLALLEQAEPWVFPDGDWETIQLDTAGEYRYRKVGVKRWTVWGHPQFIYERIMS